MKNNIEECCENCSYFRVLDNIQCKALAKKLKWDRPTLEIDSPQTFRCEVYNAKET